MHTYISMSPEAVLVSKMRNALQILFFKRDELNERLSQDSLEQIDDTLTEIDEQLEAFPGMLRSFEELIRKSSQKRMIAA